MFFNRKASEVNALDMIKEHTMEGQFMTWNVLFLYNLALLVILSFQEAIAVPQFTALFAFGDSLIDPGNNNYLPHSLAKANFVPYGVDFIGPTGRFCNGRTMIDYLGNILDLLISFLCYIHLQS